MASKKIISMDVPKIVWQWINRNLFYIGFFLATLSLIYVLMPKEGTNKLEFQKGNPWRHKNLIAPFDFPVLKTKEVVEAELDSIKRDFIPYLTLDRNKGKEAIALFENDFNNLLQSFPGSSEDKANAKTFLKDRIAQCFEQGIIELSDKSLALQQGEKQVYFIDNNVAVLKETQPIVTPREAFLQITSRFSESGRIENLLQKIGQKLNLAKYLEPNLSFDKKMNEMMINEQLASHSITRGVIQSGERIISQGDIVNNQNYILLESLQQAYKKNSLYGGWISNMIIGKIILIFVLLLVLVFYLEIFNRDSSLKKKNFALIFTNVLITFIMACLFYLNQSLSFYIIPVCILPIVIRTFMGIRASLFVHLITILMIGFLAPSSFEFVFMQSIAGTMAVITLSKFHRRGHLILTALTVIVTYSVTFLGFELIKEGSIRLIDWGELRWFALSGFLILIAYPLIFVYEKFFGFISDVTLMELSDTNHPLLRRLAEEAPGTFQHSLQVANLAEAAVAHTGGNSMLIRTGALYHDVGKIVNPHFFIENQMGGDNPHANLSNIESASVIINHVREGVSMAKKYKIPEMIIDFIKTHHGESLTRYFYLKYRDENANGTIDTQKFKYPGPNPSTREEAILMLADSVEAATRSLQVKNDENIRNIIDQIIDFKVGNHEFDDSPISFKDIKIIKEIFHRKLINIYHVRIQYPITDYLRK